MGAGCYYTHENGNVAYWIEPEFTARLDNEDQFDSEWNFFMEDIGNVMIELGYKKGSQYKYKNGLAIVEFSSTYSGEGLVIRLQPRYEDQQTLNLFNANFDRMEKKIAKEFNKCYVLAYGTSGYTACRLKQGELK